MKIFQSIKKLYNNCSSFGQILFFIAFLLVLIVFFKSISKYSLEKREGMTSQNKNTDKVVFKEGNDVYDDFYSDIYDYLIFSGVKNNFEITTIARNTKPDETSVIADIGCGTGHQVKALTEKGFNVTGVDISPSMIKQAKKKFPKGNFVVGDALDNTLFRMNSLTHVLCLYFSIYYIKDKRHFFDNCMDWLMPGGYLIVHLVERETFDPILPPGNPLYIVSPQKYAKERITKTKITFNDFVYNANFNLDKDSDIATFDEKFKFNDGKVRKQQQKLYMNDTATIANIAQDCGFILEGKIHMVKCAYESQYLYIFTKPS
jgi:ubiquinone/menaquinone biosynthesis C-methylase UbiE